MSIATLKRKSYTLYGPSHCNKQGEFSLNGTLRLPTQNLGRTVTRTPFRGPLPMGHGSGSKCRVGGWRARICKHGYPIVISNSGSCLVPQTEIKRSTMNTSGLIETKYMGILHGADANVYRVDKDAGTYMKKLSRPPCATVPIVQSGYDDGHIKTPSNCAPYTKNEERLTYEQYIQQLTSQCMPLESPYKGNLFCYS
jgi:hypothetical protein